MDLILWEESVCLLFYSWYFFSCRAKYFLLRMIGGGKKAKQQKTIVWTIQQPFAKYLLNFFIGDLVKLLLLYLYMKKKSLDKF